MAKILGLDLGTNSIGWAIRDNNIENESQILDSGVIIFPQGVGEEKGVEFSLASERTKKRASRKLYSRRKQRKSDLLKLLIDNGMCPLTFDELNNWTIYTKGKQCIYPTENFEFREWLKINPYEVRSNASNSSVSNLEFGRALYHICQRRGFKSGRKDADSGKDLIVYKQEKEKRGDKTLGEYLFVQLEVGKSVRKTKYVADDNEVNSSRISYIEEFNVLVKNQKITKELSNKLFEAIFFQRPLKSQKGSIGKCTLEKSKSRCAVSHPLFEEFRMYQFLNSIKVKERSQDKFLFLSSYPEYFEIVKELFFRKSKPSFKFAEISKAVNTKAKKNNLYFEFNYNDKYPIVGNPTMSLLKDVFDADTWDECKEIIRSKYKLSDKKSIGELVDEMWHTLFFAGDFVNDVTAEKVKHFIRTRYDIPEEQIESYEKIKLKQGYASLSKKAIVNILPFLKENIIYSHAVFYANIPQIIGKEKWKANGQYIQDNISNIVDGYKEKTLKIDIVNSLIEDFVKEYDNSDANYILDETDKKNVSEKIIAFYGKDRWNKFSEALQNEMQQEIEFNFQTQLQKRRFGGYHIIKPRLDEIIKQFLIDELKFSKEQSDKLYHPSAIETYQESTDGFLGSPFTASVRNPMAMRTLHYLRKLVNSLLKEKKISSDTAIIIELARELNDKNKRLAIERWQRERENDNKKFRDFLEEFEKDYPKYKVTDNDIIKYRLWKEQGGKCLYTDKTIDVIDIIGTNPNFDIEHTFPRSKSFDNSLVNKTLSDKAFNQIKGNKIPQELPGKYIQTALINIKDWYEKMEDLKEKIEQQRYFSNVASTVEQRNKAIQQRHYLSLEFNYWNEKYKRFTDKEINPKFKNSQLVDTGIITKYSKLFLESLFSNVFPAKGTMVADIRQSWGLPKKDRTLHYHHAIDAVVLTCMDKSIRDSLAQAFNESEALGKIEKFKVPKPWSTFTEDVDKLKEYILVVHNHKDNLLKQTKRKLKIRNKIQYDKLGNVIYQEGQGIRCSLHQDTFYGAIERVNEKDEKVIWFVKRDWASNLNEASVENIVDEAIKQRIKKHGLKNIRTEEGFILLPEEEDLKSMLIKKVRIKTNFKQLPKIKKQSHVSQGKRKVHKENYYAKLENIFAMAVYQTLNEKGKVERIHKTISAFEVAKYNQGKKKLELPVDDNIVKNKGKKTEILIPLSYVLKVNQMVLFYENTKEELNNLSNSELSKRLYKITQFEGDDGRIQLRHHKQGGADKDLVNESSLDFDKPAQKLRMSLSNFKASFENRDFEILPSGKINFIF